MTNLLAALRHSTAKLVHLIVFEDGWISYQPTPDRHQKPRTSSDFMTDLHIRTHLGR